MTLLFEIISSTFFKYFFSIYAVTDIDLGNVLQCVDYLAVACSTSNIALRYVK